MSREKWTRGPCLDRTLREPRPLPDPDGWEPDQATLTGQSLRDFPEYMAVEVTNVCNLRCTHCNYRYGLPHYSRSRGFMEFDLLRKVAGEAAEHGASLLMNYDGEPLMHPKFMSFLRHVSDLGLKTYFNTNGTLFTEEFAEELVGFYKGSVFFSVDGSKEWMEKIRLGADYDLVTKNLGRFLELNARAGWPIAVGVSLCNLGQSAGERAEFLETWLPRVNYVSMGEVNDKFGAMISEPMTVMELARRPVCGVPWSTLGVCHDGSVIPCSIHVTRANETGKIFGNVNEQSLAEIWRSPAFRAFREEVASLPEGSLCNGCQRWLSQITFPVVETNGVRERRNGFWTTYENLEKGGARHIT